jgi:hypothetical protein
MDTVTDMVTDMDMGILKVITLRIKNEKNGGIRNLGLKYNPNWTMVRTINIIVDFSRFH